LLKHRENLLDQWLDAVYPLSTDGPFGHKTKTFFKGPMGRTLSDALANLFDHILAEEDSRSLATDMDQAIRVLAVQELLPSQAAGFLFPLKALVRGLARKAELDLSEELNGFDHLLDQLTRIGFDIYSKAREELYMIQIEEQKRQTEGVFRLANKRGSL